MSDEEKQQMEELVEKAFKKHKAVFERLDEI